MSPNGQVVALPLSKHQDDKVGPAVFFLEPHGPMADAQSRLRGQVCDASSLARWLLQVAEQTPLSGLRIGELALEAGVPPGVFNIIAGFGAS